MEDRDDDDEIGRSDTDDADNSFWKEEFEDMLDADDLEDDDEEDDA